MTAIFFFFCSLSYQTLSFLSYFKEINKVNCVCTCPSVTADLSKVIGQHLSGSLEFSSSSYDLFAWMESYETNKIAQKFFMFIYFEREREWVRRGREGQTEKGWKRIPSRLHAVSSGSEAGLDPRSHEIMTWAEMKSQTLNRLSHPGAPIIQLLFTN